MALEVIGAGLGRTGTLTLKLRWSGSALARATTWSKSSPIPNRSPSGTAPPKARRSIGTKVYGAYRATVDWPGCHFYAQLADRYPAAKVILSRRDPERWYESMSKTILPAWRTWAR